MFKNIENKRCLEIGSYEGRSTIYLVEQYCNGKGSQVDAVDTWNGSVEHTSEQKSDLYKKFTHNLKNYIESGKVHAYRGASSEVLLKLVQEVRDGKRQKYDFIYIDGSHTAKDVLIDAVLAWELLKVDGLMLFDDYTWNDYPTQPSLNPKVGVDGFLNSYSGLYQIININTQMHIKKIADEFVFKNTVPVPHQSSN